MATTRQRTAYRYRYCPPFAWRGPRPMVEAFRAREMTTLAVGNTTISLDKGEWLLQTRDGSVQTMPDRTFRRWYDPVDEAAAAELRGERVRRRKPHRSRKKTRRQQALAL